MFKIKKISILLIFGLFLLTNCKTKSFELYVVNPMIKVFNDLPFEKSKNQVLHFKAAANEYESAQFVITSFNNKLEGITVKLSDLESDKNHVIKNLSWNFIGYIPLDSNTPDTIRESRCGSHSYIPEGELIRKAPCEIPDPLLEVKNLDLKANTNQPVWLTVHVPSNTPPGFYTGEVKVICRNIEKILPIELEVFPFELPEERNMFLTNWFQIEHISKAHNVEEFSDNFWRVLEKYAINMAEHRQNVVYTPWRKLIRIFQENENNWTFDFSYFDKFVKIFMDAGVDGRIELMHIGAPSRGEYVGLGVYDVIVFNKTNGETISIPGEKGMPKLLKNLENHLMKNNWLEKTMIHVSDEPNYYTIDEWKKIGRFVKEHAPGIKTIDAISVTGFDDLLDIAVPLTSALDDEFDEYKKEFNEDDGKELWFYTCCVPYGHYPNRFLDYPLSDMRILHWMNYMYDIKGYLHWGFTYGWDEHENGKFGAAKRFPPGDSHLIYPGKKGPMNSIRWETQRESLEDFEYFKLLEKKTINVKNQLGEAADIIASDFRSKEICNKLVKSLHNYKEDPNAFYTLKNLLASEITKIDKEPLFLFSTIPNENSSVIIGPGYVKIYGVTEQQAEVRINDKNVKLKPDGSFVEIVELGFNKRKVKIEVQKGDKIKIIERDYEVI